VLGSTPLPILQPSVRCPGNRGLPVEFLSRNFCYHHAKKGFVLLAVRRGASRPSEDPSADTPPQSLYPSQDAARVILPVPLCYAPLQSRAAWIMKVLDPVDSSCTSGHSLHVKIDGLKRLVTLTLPAFSGPRTEELSLPDRHELWQTKSLHRPGGRRSAAELFGSSRGRYVLAQESLE
jgi:hypothetical protein